jgi:outer membrane lipoprotein-sorting protein
MTGRWLLLLLPLVVGGVSPVAPAAETKSPLAAWLAAQANIRTWSADFIQTRTLRSLTQPLSATGHVWFAEPSRFHWELGQPPQTIAVRATSELLVIYPRFKRVERYPLTGPESFRGRAPMAIGVEMLEAGFPRSQAELESRFRIQSQTVSNRICQLVLQPKSASARKMMPQMKIDFDTQEFSLRATELQFADGSTLRNDFTNAVLNATMDEQLFAPKIANDFTVVEPLKQHD